MSWQLALRASREQSAPTIAEAWPTPGSWGEGSITENRTYWWHLKGRIANPFEVLLRVNGMVLSRDIASESDIWFRWDLGFNAGFADLQITGVEAAPKTMRLIVDPAQAKLVRKEFRLMLRDILSDTRSLASTSGLKVSLSRGNRNLPIAHLEYALEASRLLTILIRDLDTHHRKRMDRASNPVPLQNARGVTGAQWSKSRKYDRKMDAESRKRLPPGVASLVASNGGFLPTRIEQSSLTAHSNRREHSEILGLLRRCLADLRRAAKNLDTNDAGLGDLVLRDRCRTASRALTNLLDLAVFNGLQPTHSRWQHSHLYEKVEPYRSIHRIYRDLRSGVSEVEGDFANIPLRETFHLYETWVALRLAHAALLLDPSLSSESIFEDAPDRNKLTLSLQASCIQFQGNILRFKPVYNEVWRSTDGVGSYTRPMIPDIVLEVNGGDTRRIVVLDSKYRVEVELNSAISSIHMYKDALIQEGESLSGREDRQIVGCGMVVVPNVPRSLKPSADWRNEKMPIVIFRQGYQDRFSLGAVVLRPGMDMAAISQTLDGLLERR